MFSKSLQIASKKNVVLHSVQEIYEVLKEIREYVDFPQFQTTFKENSENVKTIIEDKIKAVESKEDVGIVKKSLLILKDLAVGASGSLIASGIIALLGTLPL